MIDQTIEKGVRLWEQITNAQNHYIITLGNIPPGHNLYAKYLNKWTLDDWTAIIIAIEEILEIRPDIFEPYQIDTIEKVKELIRSNQPLNNHKQIQWKIVMVMREVWNSLNDIDIKVDVYTKKG
jgi:hypothetical protein